jgi:hypothetical protein
MEQIQCADSDRDQQRSQLEQRNQPEQSAV